MTIYFVILLALLATVIELSVRAFIDMNPITLVMAVGGGVFF